MEMLIIAVVAVAAFAAVLVPLFRRRPDGREGDEFGGPPPVTTRPETGEGVVPPMAAGPVTPVAATDAGAASAARPKAAPHPTGEDEIELEIQRYRTALRAGTLCSKCGQANPSDSRFCFECGAALPLTEAQEFH
jgi:hypothetical protein